MNASILRQLLFGTSLVHILAYALSAQPGNPWVVEEGLLQSTGDWASPEAWKDGFTDPPALLELNSATRKSLMSSGYFSPYQVDELLAWRERYGAFWSIYELLSIPGFRQWTPEKLEQAFLSLSKAEQPSPRRPPEEFLLNTGGSFPLSAAYERDSGQSALYAGPALRSKLRLQWNPGSRSSLGLVYEKDPGESYLREGWPEFLQLSLLYKGKSALQEMVLGNYRRNIGMGLVHGNGFLHDPASLAPLPGHMDRLNWQNSSYEHGRMPGIALHLKWGPYHLNTWSWLRRIDLSLPLRISGNRQGDFSAADPEEQNGTKAESGSINWLDFERRGGYHRSRTERLGAALGLSGGGGLSLSRYWEQGLCGIALAPSFNTLSRRGRDSLQIRGIHSDLHLSLFGSWKSGQIRLFGEGAIDKGGHPALFLGILGPFNDFVSGELSLHHYAEAFCPPLASAYSAGNRISHEQGITASLHADVGRSVRATLSMEALHFPSPRYQCAVPSSLYRLRLRLSSPPSSKLDWHLRLSHKITASTPASTIPGPYPLKEKSLTRLDARIGNRQTNFGWSSRIIYSWCRDKDREAGSAMIQQFDLLRTPGFKLQAQFILFRADNWDSRLYAYQPGLYREFNFPLLYGRGQRTTFLARIKAGRKLRIGLRLTHSHYPKQSKTGSGYNTRPGANKWEWMCQLRYRL